MPDPIAPATTETVDPVLDKMLSDAEAAENIAQPPDPTPPADAPAKPPEQAPAGDEKPGDKPNDLPADTSAATDKTKPPEPQGKTETSKKSEFAKSQERLDKTWKAVTERKAQLDATETQLKAREDAVVRSELKLKETQAKAAAKYSPEDYENSGNKMQELAESYRVQAKGWERQAQEYEDEGKLLEAEKARAKGEELKEAYAAQKVKAREAKEYAAHLRNNPDPTLQHIAKRNEDALKGYTFEAVKKWPDLAKDGSEFQKKLATYESNLKQQGLPIEENPILRWHVAQAVAWETDAARVPDLEKSLGAAQARVKELEALTAPSGGSAAAQRPSTPTTNSDEQEATELRSMALQMS